MTPRPTYPTRKGGRPDASLWAGPPAPCPSPPTLQALHAHSLRSVHTALCTHTLCTHTAHTLHTHTALTAHTLHKLHAQHVLPTVSTHPLGTQHEHSSHTPHTLNTFSTRTPYTLNTHRARTARSTHTTHIARSICTARTQPIPPVHAAHRERTRARTHPAHALNCEPIWASASSMKSAADTSVSAVIPAKRGPATLFSSVTEEREPTECASAKMEHRTSSFQNTLYLVRREDERRVLVRMTPARRGLSTSPPREEAGRSPAPRGSLEGLPRGGLL